MPSHCTLNLLLIHNYKAPHLVRGSHITMSHASFVLLLEFKIKLNQLISTNWALHPAAEHMVEYTVNWKIRPQHSYIFQTSSGNQTFSSVSLPGLILCISGAKGESHHYCNKCGPAVTLSCLSLSLSLSLIHTHTIYKQNNVLTNLKYFILHINYSLHQKLVLFNSRSRAEDIKKELYRIPEWQKTTQTVHTTHCLILLSDNTPTQNLKQFLVHNIWIKLLYWNYSNVQTCVPRQPHSLYTDC